MTEPTIEERITEYLEIEMDIHSSPENVTILTIGPSSTLYTIMGLNGWEVYVTNKTQQISVRKPIVDRITEYLWIERGIKRDPGEVQVLKTGYSSTIFTVKGCDFIVSVTNKTQQISIILS